MRRCALPLPNRPRPPGACPSTDLQKAYASVLYAPGDLGNAIEISSRDPGPGSRAMLFQAAGITTDTGQRARIVDAALDRARRQGGYLLAVQVNLQYLLPIAPADDLAWFAADAGRALYAAGHFEQANAWLALAQRHAANEPEPRPLLLPLPSMPASPVSARRSSWDAAAVAKWRQAQAGGNPASDPAERLFAIFDGLGEPIGGSWSLIGQDAGATAARRDPGPVVRSRRCRRQASHRRDGAARRSTRWARPDRAAPIPLC